MLTARRNLLAVQQPPLHSGTRNNSAEPRHAVLIAFHRRNSGPTLGYEPLPSHETVLRLGNAAYLLCNVAE
ncbi:hypothetical protein [Kibdelosporangium philippinense]|uniref:hypothetical protein n=1 Tax=Kibdelosporangium philippinense TaxID=211113 RepID=UPI00360A69EF